MCEMAYLIAPRDADFDAIAELVERFKVGRGPVEGCAMPIYPGERMYYVLPRSHCHCLATFDSSWVDVLRTAITSRATPYLGVAHFEDGYQDDSFNRVVIPEPSLTATQLREWNGREEPQTVLVVERAVTTRPITKRHDTRRRRRGR